jgi:hypothetical protein
MLSAPLGHAKLLFGKGETILSVADGGISNSCLPTGFASHQ